MPVERICRIRNSLAAVCHGYNRYGTSVLLAAITVFINVFHVFLNVITVILYVITVILYVIPDLIGDPLEHDSRRPVFNRLADIRTTVIAASVHRHEEAARHYLAGIVAHGADFNPGAA